MASSVQQELIRAFQFPGNKEKVYSLLPRVSEPRTIRSKFGSDFLHYAVSRGWPDVVVKLIEEYKFNPYHEDDDGNTPLYWAAYRGHKEIVEYLVSVHGANPLKKNKIGHSPLDYSFGATKKFLKNHISKYCIIL